LPSPDEWTVDEPSHAGFACLGFSMTAPQYLQYMYAASPDGKVEMSARGDRNRGGKLSTFVLRGEVLGDELAFARSMKETDPAG